MAQMLLAHRGYSAIAPENTKLAFDCAVQFGFDGVEFDVHLTKDNKVVIIHDETIYRTSNGKGMVQNKTFEDLSKFDYGRGFKIHHLPKQKLMTLDEFLKLYMDKFKVINIEIKTDEIEYKGLEEEVVKIINKSKISKNKLILSSFNFNSLEKLHKFDNELSLGFLWWKHLEFKKIDPKRIKTICKYLNPWIKVYKKKEWRKEYHKIDLPYCLWTLKTKEKYKKFLKDKRVVAQISNYKY